MKSFKNDDKIILQQKIIHLGAEVKRLTAVVERLNSKTFLKNLEKEKLEQEEKIQVLTEQLARIVEEGNEKVNHLQRENAQYQLELSKQREMHVSRTSTLQDEVFELKKELTKQKDDHQGKLVTISNEVHQLKQQCELERTGHLKALNLNEELTAEMEKLKRELDKQSAINFELKEELTKQKEDHQGKLVTISNEVHQLKQQCEAERTGHLKTLNLNEELTAKMEELKRELDKQSAINMDLEKEYEMVKDTVKGLLIKIESSNQAHEGYQTIADINEKLEGENQSYRKMIADLEEEVKTLYDENSLLTEDIKKLNECVNDLEKKGDQVIHNSTKVSSLEGKKTASPIQEGDTRIQSWFYNNVKKNT
ncbi:MULTISPECIES: hypothetical protein [unclassified Sutcliffiella]|uniref:hypothetical protein n=1 Tax=unclassified Sutcliffiella TaxID=2837532 RepID=UPI0030D391EF